MLLIFLISCAIDLGLSITLGCLGFLTLGQVFWLIFGPLVAEGIVLRIIHEYAEDKKTKEDF